MKKFCFALVCLIAVGCQPKALNELTDAGSALKTVLVNETVQIAGGKKQVVLIAPKAFGGPIAKLGEEFKAALEKKGLNVVEIKHPELGDPMRYTTYGWKATDFEQTVQQYPDVGAIVSLVGVPIPEASLAGSIPTHPSVLAVAVRQIGVAPGVASNPNIVNQMLEAKAVQLAIVDGNGTAGGKNDKIYKVFNENFQILRATP